MAYVWENEEIYKLIEQYQAHRCLWDSSTSEYKNKMKKAEAWDALSKALDVPRRDVEIKVHILRSQFTREKKKVTSGDGSGGARKSRWMFYDRLKFLLDVATSSVDNGQTKVTHRSPATEVILRQTRPKLLRRKRRTSDSHNDPVDSVRSLGDLIEMDSIARRAMHESKDEFDIYGQYVASELRAVKDKGAMLRAKSIINDVLIRLRLEEHGSSHGQDDSHGHGGSHEQPDAALQAGWGEGTEEAPTHVKPEEMVTCHRTK